jgi:hypothetical protein
VEIHIKYIISTKHIHVAYQLQENTQINHFVTISVNAATTC